ncbi:type VI secretion system membrane subunit TssM [Paraburkholderia caffeinilytica]|uniref:type VI secretion system membrane subunit TssM n=1 Tax=Paraburkholderia caffeinilytica TaxID=1761016 RepID=UPI0038BBE4AF
MNLIKRLSGWLWSWALLQLVGMIVIGALIWTIGPLLSIGEARPLESETSRYVLIAFVLLVWCVRLVWRARKHPDNASMPMFFRRRQASQRDNAGSEDGSEPVAELRARFRDALHLLRHEDRRTGRLAAWLDRLSAQHVYRLPWYLVVGSAGSGKTTALANSGLELSIAEQAARAASGRIDPTQHCDWWFSNHAVLVDTPGHYLEAADADTRRGAEWGELLALLRKYRPRQPINGALLMVGIDELLAMSESDRAAYATRLRKPLQLMQAKFDVRVPVYLCFTRMDRITGFREYFSGLNRDERAQVWGTTFTAGDASRGDAAGFASGGAFDRLVQRLNEGLCDVLIAEPDVDTRALAYLFPQQFASLKEILDDFLVALFRTSRLETNLVARGVYLSSALQDGPEVDRILTPIRQRLHIETAPPPRIAPAHSQGYFLKHLLQDAVFADAGFAGVSRTLQRRSLIAHASIAALTSGVLLALLAGWTTSYLNNSAYLNEVNAHVAAFNQQANRPIVSNLDTVASLSPMLDALQRLPRSERFDVDAPPTWRYGMGLYQGKRINDAGDAVYRRALDEKLLPQASTRIESILANSPANDLEYSYDALKAYLMLHDTTHYDAGFLAAWLTLDTDNALPSNTQQHDRARLEAHIANLFESHKVTSPFALNVPLVNSVRERLERDSPALRAYHLLRRELLRTMQGAPVTAASAGGPQAALVFRRRSGLPLTDGISTLYTYRGYWDTFDKRVDGAAARLIDEDPWVLGIRPASTTDRARLALEIRRAYFNDYIDVWDRYLGDLTLMDSRSITQSTQIARTLSASDSPLRQLLLAAANETNLLRTRTAEQPAEGKFQKRIGEARQSLAALFSNVAPDAPVSAADSKPETMVDDHFEPLRRLVATPAGAAGSPLDSNLRVVDALYSYLTSASAALNSGNAPPQTDVFNALQADAGRLPMPLRNMFSDLSQAGSGQISGAARANIAQDAQGGIGRVCRHMIAGRYPFERSAPRDVALDDFSKLFASGGLMDSFFQKNLASQIDVSHSRWTFRGDAANGAPVDARLAGSFQNADTIRTVFFPGNATAPSLQIELTPLELDPGITQYVLDIDGQTIRYAHGPQIPATVKWPNPGGANLVSLQVNTPNGSDSLQTHGPWALHRLLDKARITPGAAPESFVATFDVNGHKLALRVTASSSYNPFQLTQMNAFSCPS